jgi:hypothetical protein
MHPRHADDTPTTLSTGESAVADPRWSATCGGMPPTGAKAA